MDKNDLQQLGDQAAQQYLEKGMDLNDAIADITTKNKLNPHQVERVVEFANNTTRSTIFRDKNVDQARVVFPTAEAKIVLSKTTEPAGNTPVDYLIPPSANRRFATAEDDSPADLSEVRKAAHVQEFHKAASVLRDANDSLTMAEFNYENAKDRFFSESINYLRFNHDPEGIVKIAMTLDAPLFKALYPMLKSAAPRDVKRDVITMEELMNPNIKATYINDDHPLVIRYKDCVTASQDIIQRARYANEADRNRNILEGIIEQEKLAAVDPSVTATPGTEGGAAAKPSPFRGSNEMGGSSIRWL